LELGTRASPARFRNEESIRNDDSADNVVESARVDCKREIRV
jgi:hypothetical protein